MCSRVFCIVGPTASGKSEIADIVAETLDSAVVSVDAMQVYRGMDIGTAKVPVAERRVPLLMVDVCDPGDDYSVELFQADARNCVDALLSNGRTPVLCGGTGLYLDAVIDEMEFPAGAVGNVTRSRYEAIAAEKGVGALYAMLNERDPMSAELIHPNNVRRVVRALELLDEGTSYAVRHRGLKSRSPHYPSRIFALTMSRERLYGRIDARVDTMFESGLVDEVETLLSSGIELSLTASQAIGYSECIDYLQGRIKLDDAIGSTKARTRRYAKRQLSWIKRDGRANVLDMDELSPEEAASVVLRDARTIGRNR